MTFFVSGKSAVRHSQKASDDERIILLYANYTSFFMLFPSYFVHYALSFQSMTNVVGYKVSKPIATMYS
jgi:hypothetical protein